MKIVIAFITLLLAQTAYSDNSSEWLKSYLLTVKDEKKQSLLAQPKLPFDAVTDIERTLISINKTESRQSRLIKHKIGKDTFYTKVFLPKNYSSNKKYPVIFVLHGLVRTKKWKISDAWWTGIRDNAFTDYIQVYPSAWSKHKWWQNSQVENIKYIHNVVHNEYNIDVGKVYLLGISDGGSGSFFINSKVPDLFAASVSIIGNPQVISLRNNGINQESYPLNYSNRPYLVINTSRDELYPSNVVKEYTDYFKLLGANIDFKVIEGRHSLKAFRDSTKLIKAFFESNSANDYQKKIRFQTNSISPYNKFEWLIIDEITPNNSNSLLKGLLESKVPSGIVEAVSDIEMNTIRIKTYNIKSFTVLIPHNVFDKNKHLKIYINDVLRYNQSFSSNIKTALKWLNSLSIKTLYIDELKFEV